MSENLTLKVLFICTTAKKKLKTKSFKVNFPVLIVLGFFKIKIATERFYS